MTTIHQLAVADPTGITDPVVLVGGAIALYLTMRTIGDARARAADIAEQLLNRSLSIRTAAPRASAALAALAAGVSVWLVGDRTPYLSVIPALLLGVIAGTAVAAARCSDDSVPFAIGDTLRAIRHAVHSPRYYGFVAASAAGALFGGTNAGWPTRFVYLATVSTLAWAGEARSKANARHEAITMGTFESLVAVLNPIGRSELAEALTITEDSVTVAPVPGRSRMSAERLEMRLREYLPDYELVAMAEDRSGFELRRRPTEGAQPG